MTTYAPGAALHIPARTFAGAFTYGKGGGTSYSAPQVAGLAAYLRSLPSQFAVDLREAAKVKKMICLLHRRFSVDDAHIQSEKQWNSKLGDPNQPRLRMPIIWSGQVGTRSCLIDYQQMLGNSVCPEIKLDGDSDGQTLEPCGPGEGGSPTVKRQTGGSCPVILDPGTGAGCGGGGRGHTLTFTSGPQPSPTCASGTGCGGVVCTGFWCGAIPTTIKPPDHHDPKDPNGGGNQVPTRTIGWPPGPSGPSATSRTSTSPNNPEPTCDDKCKLDRGNPCNCNENGCDDQSPACCANADCPKCECGESSCTPSSPACCANNSCKWAEPSVPPPPGLVIFIALSEGYVPVTASGTWIWFRDWMVFSAPSNGRIDLCYDTPDLRCSYSGSRTALGSLSCPRVSGVNCEEIDRVFEDVCNPLTRNPTRYAMVHCWW